MTVLVGIYCDDGIVIAGDQQATHGTATRPTVGSPVTKISIIRHDVGLFAYSGFTGLGQQINAVFERLIDPNRTYFDQVPAFQGHVHNAVMNFAQRAKSLVDFYPDGQGEVPGKSLVAARFNDGLKLFEVTPIGSCDLINDSRWTSIGSGQQNADPVLAFLWDIYWKDRPPRVEEAVLTAYWAVKATIASETMGVGFDIDVFVIDATATGTRVRQISQQQLTDDEDFISRVKDGMRAFRDAMIPTPQTQAADEADNPPELGVAPSEAAPVTAGSSPEGTGGAGST